MHMIACKYVRFLREPDFLWKNDWQTTGLRGFTKEKYMV